MKKIVEILLILTLLYPSVESFAVEVQPQLCDAYFDEATTDGSATVKQSPPAAQQSFTLTATKIRRTPPVRVKVLRLFHTKPSIRSEADRRSELRSGDVATMRI